MKIEELQAVILAGGKGTRIREETDITPKPMIKIGGMPVIEHIMKRFMYYNLNNFIVCTGYKYEVINEYFSNYRSSKNFSYNSSKDELTSLEDLEEFNIEILFTGNETNTGGRIFRIRDRIKNDIFLVTYGDGLANINIKNLIEFHNSHQKIGTVTTTTMNSRFGLVNTNENNLVTSFNEKSKEKQKFNIGYMVFNKAIFNYLDENSILEKEPLTKLVKDEQLVSYFHDGFFEPMDTYREYLNLNNLWEKNKAPWNQF